VTQPRTLAGVNTADASDKGLLQSIPRLVWQQVSDNLDRTAITYRGAGTTYGALWKRVLSIQSAIGTAISHENATVMLLLSSKPDLIAAALAIMRSGHILVLADPDSPVERLRVMFASSSADLVLYDHESKRVLAEFGQVEHALDLSYEVPSEVDLHSDARPHESAESEVCYIHFTSGSTGIPKGAIVPTRAIVNRLVWSLGVQHVTEADSILFRTSHAFDASIWELFGLFIVGGRTVIAEGHDRFDPDEIIATVQRHEITVLQAVPTLFRMLVGRKEWRDCESLRLIVSGGEPLDPELAGEIMAALPGAELWNSYGPTECASDVLTHRVSIDDQHRRRVPIGLPITGTEVQCLTADGQACAPGIPGQIVLSAVCVGIGYLSGDDDRFGRAEVSGRRSRFYKTGDLGVVNSSGEVEYLGRIDAQLKINGMRFAAEEIERAVRGVSGLDEVVCAPTRESGLAIVYTASHDLSDVVIIRRELRRHLPSGAIPTRWVRLAEIPKLPSGKIDRRATSAAIEGIGALIGATFSRRIMAKTRSGFIIVVGQLFIAVGVSLIAATNSFGLQLVLLAIAMMAAPILNGTILAFAMSVVPTGCPRTCVGRRHSRRGRPDPAQPPPGRHRHRHHRLPPHDHFFRRSNRCRGVGLRRRIVGATTSPSRGMEDVKL
jgi:amino acid adenylation domain-containing protein